MYCTTTSLRGNQTRCNVKGVRCTTGQMRYSQGDRQLGNRESTSCQGPGNDATAGPALARLSLVKGFGYMMIMGEHFSVVISVV